MWTQRYCRQTEAKRSEEEGGGGRRREEEGVVSVVW